jgi:hypothetical protein
MMMMVVLRTMSVLGVDLTQTCTRPLCRTTLTMPGDTEAAGKKTRLTGSLYDFDDPK